MTPFNDLQPCLILGRGRKCVVSRMWGVNGARMVWHSWDGCDARVFQLVSMGETREENICGQYEIFTVLSILVGIYFFISFSFFK